MSLLLLYIAWQDFKSLHISVWLLVDCIIVSTVYSYIFPNDLLPKIILNGSISVFVLLCLALYVHLRFGNLKAFFSEYFGMGDLLMIAAMLLYFPFPDFVYFLTGVSAISLVSYLILKKTGIMKHEQIPLAGFWAVCWVAYIWLEKFIF